LGEYSSNVDTQGEIYAKQLILQRQKKQFLEFLQELALAMNELGVEAYSNFDFAAGWEENEPTVSALYKDVKIMTG